MTVRMATVVLLLTLSGLLRQMPVFRSEASAVQIDVSVMQDGRLVEGLGAGDFEVAENGLTQTIEDVTLESLDLLVTLVLDVSASVSVAARTESVRCVNRLGQGLRDSDSLRVVGVAGAVSALNPERAGEQLSKLIEPTLADGGTRLRDAIGLALIEPQAPGRRHVVILLTDGITTNDVLSPGILEEVARRTHASVSTVLLEGAPRVWASRYVADVPVASAFESTLNQLAVTSGGWMLSATEPTGPCALVVQIIERARTRYVLRYTPTDVVRTGWRAVEVRVKGRGRLQVSFKEGYFRR